MRNNKTKEELMVKEKLFSNKKSATQEILNLKQEMEKTHSNTL